jgi:glutamate carboxypeptidase
VTAWDRARALDRLERLVSTESPSGDPDRLDEVYALVAEWGTQAVGRAPERVVHQGVPHLVWRSDGPARVLLVCHADTVFPVGTIARRPFRVEDGIAYGPGVFDMKAGIVIALDALERITDTDGVAWVVTGDEETGSLTSRALIEELARSAAAALVLEPSLDGALKVGRKGGAFYEITFHGLAAHAGLEPERGRNALLALARWALLVTDLADLPRGTTVTPTRAASGTATNVVPDHGALFVDVRASSTAELLRVDRELRALAQSGSGVDDGVGITVDGGVNRPPLEAESAAGLVALCRAEASRLGQPEPAAALVGGGSDGNFTAALGVPTLDGLGATGHGAHAEHEWVEVESMSARADLVAAMLESLTRSGP